jgi:hypothetical protein
MEQQELAEFKINPDRRCDHSFLMLVLKLVLISSDLTPSDLSDDSDNHSLKAKLDLSYRKRNKERSFDAEGDVTTSI